MRRIARCGEMILWLLLCGSPVIARTTEELSAKGRELLYEKKDYSAAAETFTNVVRMEPACADGYFGRGTACAAQADYDGAIKDLSEAIRLNPRMGSAHRNRGGVHSLKGDDRQAWLILVRRSASIRVIRRRTWIECALHLKMKEYDPAIADASEAIRLDAKFAEAYNNRTRTRTSGKATMIAHFRTRARRFVSRRMTGQCLRT